MPKTDKRLSRAPRVKMITGHVVPFRQWNRHALVYVVIAVATTLITTMSTIITLVAATSAPISSTSLLPSSSSPLPPSLMLLDVDNTLYDETEAKIEEQIVRNTHDFCHLRLGFDADGRQADELFHQYGSTIEGLRQTVWKNLPTEHLRDKLQTFYEDVYDPKRIDISRLMPSAFLLKEEDGSGGSTGYTHATFEQDRLVRRLLKSRPAPLALASNSPSWHIRRVLKALGLARLYLDGQIYTPDRRQGIDQDDNSGGYPTKHDPMSFFHRHIDEDDQALLLHQHDDISFFDDSFGNLQRVQEAFPRNVKRLYKISNSQNDDENHHKIASSGMTLVDALLEDLHLVEPEERYKFDQIQYLECKNHVDRRSIDVKTWDAIMSEMEDRWNEKTKKSISETALTVVDVGAGLLFILDLILHGDFETGLRSLWSERWGVTSMARLQYVAYESNSLLLRAIRAKLELWGFVKVRDISDVETLYQHKVGNIEVKLILGDFASLPSQSDDSPDLIVGCCFADLIEPEKLVPQLISSFHLLDGHSEGDSNDTLVYFPITFVGMTQFLPSRPFEFRVDDDPTSNSFPRKRVIPSDTKAFQLYSDALTSSLGHNLEPNRLISTLQDYGVELASVSPSDWKINPESDSYLYETMLYFFGRTGGPRLLEEGYDAGGWLHRARSTRPSIQVSNQDLLFRVPCVNEISELSGSGVRASADVTSLAAQEILFTAPYQVSFIHKDLSTKLGPREVLIRSTCSLISSGTELKIFKGLFEQDAVLDVNIKGMQGERMAYPLSYGYCLVGRVVACGSEVPEDKFHRGGLVFTFSPHASYVLTDMDAIQSVPEGIDPFDAIFMPSVETALSLIHDANVQLGENVGVFGQGLIGLFVTALLTRESSNGGNMRQMLSLEREQLFGSLTVFDMIPERLALSSKLGASQALFPSALNEADVNLKFDVAIEVSGNARALQAAIDQTLDGGRVIVGSWYGSGEVPLRLGIDFHRSHKVIKTSQVSEIPARLSRLWSKQRRFALAWQLVRELQPSKIGLLTKICSLVDADEAYNALDSGTEIAVAFDYSK